MFCPSVFFFPLAAPTPTHGSFCSVWSCDMTLASRLQHQSPRTDVPDKLPYILRNRVEIGHGDPRERGSRSMRTQSQYRNVGNLQSSSLRDTHSKYLNKTFWCYFMYWNVLQLGFFCFYFLIHIPVYRAISDLSVFASSFGLRLDRSVPSFVVAFHRATFPASMVCSLTNFMTLLSWCTSEHTYLCMHLDLSFHYHCMTRNHFYTNIQSENPDFGSKMCLSVCPVEACATLFLSSSLSS